MVYRLEASTAAAALATVLVTPYTAFSQQIDRGAARDAREVRLNAREMRIATKRFWIAAEPVDSDTTRNSWSIGVADDKDEHGTHVQTTPFILSHRRGSDDDWWKVSVQGDGYKRVRSNDQSGVDGAADLTFDIVKSFGKDFSGGFGATVPTGGTAGSSAASQHVQLRYEHDFKNDWAMAASAELAHDNASSSGESKYAKTLYAELSRTLWSGHDLVISATHQRRGGSTSTTDLSAEYDFPFPLGKSFKGALSVTRGITGDWRHTTFEFDLNREF